MFDLLPTLFIDLVLESSVHCDGSQDLIHLLPSSQCFLRPGCILLRTHTAPDVSVLNEV